MEKKKILIVKGDSSGCFPVPASKGGAVQTLIEQIISENEKKQKLDIEVVTFFDDKAGVIADNNYPNTKFHWVKQNRIVTIADSLIYQICKILRRRSLSYKSLFSAFIFIISASKILKKHKYNAVILENYIPLAWAIRFSRYSGNFYYHLHNNPRTNALCSSIIQRCSGFICVSDFIAQQIAKSDNPIGPIPNEKIKVLLNGIDSNLFKPLNNDGELNNIKEKYGIKTDDKILLFAGRLCREKGVGEFVDSLQYLDLHNIKVVIVGDVNYTMSTGEDPFIVELKQKIYPIQEKVVMTGFVPHEFMPLYYNIADIIILPSIWDEPLSLAICEAISCGKHLITTNSGGIPEIASGYATILKRDDQLTRNIAKTVEFLLGSEPIDKRKIAEYQEIHSIQSYYDNFTRIVDELMGT